MKNLHAVVARSRFRSENIQNTSASDYFWNLRCRKSARRCGAKYISKSKYTKHLRVRTTFGKLRCRKSARHCGAKYISKLTCCSGPLLEVEMSKKCTPLWREAHLQVKMYKTHMFAPLLEVRMMKKCTPLWRETHFEVKIYKIPHNRATFGGSDVASLHYTTLQDITLHYTPIRYITLKIDR